MRDVAGLPTQPWCSLALAGAVTGAIGIGGGVGVEIDASVAQGSPASATNTSRAGQTKCSPADVQRPGALVHSGSYLRYCGSGRAVVRVGNKSFTIQGGRCTSTRVGFGVMGNGRHGRGVSLVLEHPNRRGRNDIIDGVIQLPGAHLRGVISGTAIKADDLETATFSLYVGPVTKVTGRWTCGLRI